jgi:hypothetical protein
VGLSAGLILARVNSFAMPKSLTRLSRSVIKKEGLEFVPQGRLRLLAMDLSAVPWELTPYNHLPGDKSPGYCRAIPSGLIKYQTHPSPTLNHL